MKKIKIILCVIAVVLLISLIALAATKKKSTRNIVINNPETSETLEITNYTSLSRIYSGQEKISNFNSKVEEIAEIFLPDVMVDTEKMDSNELKEYFEKNKSEITKQIGIDEFSDFQNLITVLRSLNTENIKIKTVNIDLSNYSENENYAEFTMVFINENGKKIDFNSFLNMKNNPSKYIKLIPVI